MGLTLNAYNAYVVRGEGDGVEAKCLLCIRQNSYLPEDDKSIYEILLKALVNAYFSRMTLKYHISILWCVWGAGV